MLEKLRAACVDNAGPNKGGLSVKDMRALAEASGLPSTGGRSDLRVVLCTEFDLKSQKVQKTQKVQKAQGNEWWGPKKVQKVQSAQVVQDWEDLLFQQQQEQQEQQKQEQEQQWKEVKSTKKVKAVKAVKAKKAAKKTYGVNTVKAGKKAKMLQSRRVTDLADVLSAKVVDASAEIDAAINSDKHKAYFALLDFRFPHQNKEENEAIPRYYGDNGQFDPKTGGIPIVALIRGYGIKVDPETRAKTRYDFDDDVLDELSARFPDLTFGELYRRGRTMKDIHTKEKYKRPGNNQVVVVTNQEKWDELLAKDSKKKLAHDVNKEVAKSYIYKRRRAPSQHEQSTQHKQVKQKVEFNLNAEVFPSL